MRSWLSPLALALLTALSACSSDAGDGADTGGEAIGTAPADAPAISYAAPQVAGGARYWDTIVMQNEGGFDGVLLFGSTTADGEPDRVAILDRRTGAIALFASPGDDGASANDELATAGDALASLDGSSGDGTAMADFVTDQNKCMLKFAAEATLAVGAVLAAPYVIAGAATAVASVEDAAAAISEQGLRAFAEAAARAAWASPRFRALLAFKLVKEGVRGWLLFSDKGKALTAPVRRQVSAVVHAKCWKSGP